MTAELVVLENAQRDVARPMSAAEIRAGVNLIQEVMKSVMKEGVHFGTIPGTPKPTLYKPGAEKILVTFRIATDPIVEDLSTSDEARYRVTVFAKSSSGNPLGSSVGECSSNEEKYRWRAAICREEFDETPEDRRREVWKRVRGSAEKVRQVRTNPADVANTVLKMATKRAKIAVTLDVTAASDIFNQDIEDLPEELQRELAHEDGQEPRLSEPRPAPPRAEGPGIRVESVRVAKKGTKKNGDPYTLTIIHLSDGNDYQTFDDGMAALANAARQKAAAVSFAFEETERGRKLTNLEEVR
jgi:hypothetical protein